MNRETCTEAVERMERDRPATRLDLGWLKCLSMNVNKPMIEYGIAIGFMHPERIEITRLEVHA